MKSILNIVDKLSQNEVESFRAFLSSHSKNKKNKKLQLFNELVKQSQENPALFESDSFHEKQQSRQSAYQVKKRLQDDLYSFLVSQQQYKNGNDTLFLEMDCHKKLYCFKILFDKGVHAHAYQILEEVLNIAMKHSLHTIYLETLNLKNVYFPLTRTGMKKKILVTTQINKLKKNISRNLYINQYLSDSTTRAFESDVALRRRLINETLDPMSGDNEYIVDRLREVNRHLYHQEFKPAYEKLKDMAPTEPENFADPAIFGLIYTELIKTSICLNLRHETEEWIRKAEIILGYSDAFLPILLELKFISNFRLGRTGILESILKQASNCQQIISSEQANAKWSFYAMFYSFLKHEFTKVIKLANADAIYSLKEKSWLIIARLLEILSIHEMHDIDWLYYKIESLRKTIAGSGHNYPRLHHLAAHIKNYLYGKTINKVDSVENLQQIEGRFPWHPLSNELLNLCDHIKIIATVNHPVLTVM